MTCSGWRRIRCRRWAIGSRRRLSDLFKGKWHASHAHLDAEDGEGFLLSIDDDGKPLQENIEEYLKADLLDDYGFSEWVGPEPHGLGKHNTGTVKDPFTADETIELLSVLTAMRATSRGWRSARS